jgi:hypothetical protein
MEILHLQLLTVRTYERMNERSGKLPFSAHVNFLTVLRRLDPLPSLDGCAAIAGRPQSWVSRSSGWDESQIIDWCHVALSNQASRRVRTRRKISQHRAELLPRLETRSLGLIPDVTLRSTTMLITKCSQKADNMIDRPNRCKSRQETLK